MKSSLVSLKENYSKCQIFNSIFLAERNQVSGKPNKNSNADSNNDHRKPTWISDIFQGIFTSETRCLNCETVTSKDEDFFDLSIDVEQNTSITSCLRNFSNTETLCSDNKFQCDSCSTLQEAHVSKKNIEKIRESLFTFFMTNFFDKNQKAENSLDMLFIKIFSLEFTDFLKNPPSI